MKSNEIVNNMLHNVFSFTSNKPPHRNTQRNETPSYYTPSSLSNSSINSRSRSSSPRPITNINNINNIIPSTTKATYIENNDEKNDDDDEGIRDSIAL